MGTQLTRLPFSHKGMLEEEELEHKRFIGSVLNIYSILCWVLSDVFMYMFPFCYTISLGT